MKKSEEIKVKNEHNKISKKKVSTKEDTVLVNEDKKTKSKKSIETKPNDDIFKESKRHHRHGLYFSYNTRVSFCFIMFVCLFVLSLFCLFKSIDYSKEEYVQYKESSDMDYVFYLFPDSFYEKKSISKGDAITPIASAIDKILVKFKYNFNFVNNSFPTSFKYNIDADLVITDKDSKEKYYEKHYDLKKPAKLEMKSGQNFQIADSIMIDYVKFNDIACDINTKLYGLETISKLIVKMNIDKNSMDNNLLFKSNDTANVKIEIPLFERTMANTSPMVKNIPKDTKQVLRSANCSLIYSKYLLLFVLFQILLIVFLIKLIKLLFKLKPKKSKYDKFIKRVLLEYDRLIVVTTTPPDFSNGKIIKINKFAELLDVRDNIKKPILYYVVKEHEKSYFFINDDTEIYILIVKAVDLNK